MSLNIDKEKCCGCSACVQVCPKHCISFEEDKYGFYYPSIKKEFCIDCGLCEKVCPYLNPNGHHNPFKVLAAFNPNEEIRMKSSSGGIFCMLAESVIAEGGVVFGVRFNEDWEVMHDYTESRDGLEAFLGSKYVQSRIGNSYKQVKKFLKDGRKVLFSGTPCQIQGLVLFLRKEYENLVTIECICHGVPSPGMWRQYVKEQTKYDGRTIADIKSINFRDKCSGWADYSFTIKYKDGKNIHHLHDDNYWERAFINNIDLRASCHNCMAKCIHSKANITLGDLWGAEKLLPETNDNKGLSIVVVHNEKGINNLIGMKCMQKVSFDEVIKFNHTLEHSAPKHPQREDFFLRVQKQGFIKSVKSMLKEPFILKIKKTIKNMLKSRKS